MSGFDSTARAVFAALAAFRKGIDVSALAKCLTAFLRRIVGVAILKGNIMFAIQFQPRFSDRPAFWVGSDGRLLDQGQVSVFFFFAFEDRASAQALCASKRYEGLFVVDVREATPEDLIRRD